MDNKDAVAAMIMVAILAAGLTVVIQPQVFQNTITTTEQSVSTSTVTSVMTSTETQLVSTTVTHTETVTSTITSTTTTSITTTTTTVTSSEQPPALKTVSINLISLQNDKSASWSKTHLSILITTTGTAVLTPDLQAVNSAGRAISQWKNSITQFVKNNTKYIYLSSLTFTVYVQGVNDTALRRRPDIMVLFTDTLPSLLGETKLFVTNTPLIASANSTVAVQGLNTLGLQNVLIHELGHAFGLNHTFIETDAMYGERETQAVSTERLCPSTLDLYALASIYQWITTEFYRPYDGTSVTLPQNIDYRTVACSQ